MQIENYPFVKELITDLSGNVQRVALDLKDYQKLLEFVEDEGLYLAMKEVSDEESLSLEAALVELERDED